MLFRECPGASGIDIAGGHNPAGRIFCEILGVPVGHSAGSDNGESDGSFQRCFHRKNP